MRRSKSLSRISPQEPGDRPERGGDRPERGLAPGVYPGDPTVLDASTADEAGGVGVRTIADRNERRRVTEYKYACAFCSSAQVERAGQRSRS